VPVFFVCLS